MASQAVACPECGYANSAGVELCSMCSSLLARRPQARAREAEPAAREAHDGESQRAPFRIHEHAIAATLICLILQIAFGGFPGTLAPVRLFWAALGSVLFGVPLGYLANIWADEPRRGALLGLVLSGVIFAPLNLALGAGLGEALTPSVSGAIAGFLVGLHIEVSRK